MPEGASSISRGGVLAHRGGFGTFGWTGTGRWNDSEAGTTYDSAAATPPAPGLPSPGRAGGAKPGRGHRPKPGRWPGAHLRVSRHSARPAGRTGKSNRASNLKSHPVAFGISRPTRTATEESNHSTPKWTGRRPRAGLLHTVARAGRRQPAIQGLTYAAATLPCPRPATPRPRPGICSRASGATRGPGDGPKNTFGYRGPRPARLAAETVLE